MNAPDLSTKLKLMGVDVASFGDYFAHERMVSTAASLVPTPADTGVAIRSTRRGGERDTRNDPVKCLTYHDPFSATYKKFIFTADGEYLLGGIMIGDTGSFTKLVAIVKKKVRIVSMSSSRRLIYLVAAEKARRSSFRLYHRSKEGGRRRRR